MYLNLSIVFVVSGIWHGANWTFVIWGMLHAVYMVAYFFFFKKIKFQSVLFKIASWTLTLAFVSLAWVFFIAENMPFKTEISTLLIITKLEQYDYAGSTAIAVVMLLISFVMLLLINMLQRWSSRRKGMEAI